MVAATARARQVALVAMLMCRAIISVIIIVIVVISTLSDGYWRCISDVVRQESQSGGATTVLQFGEQEDWVWEGVPPRMGRVEGDFFLLFHWIDHYTNDVYLEAAVGYCHCQWWLLLN